MRVIFLISFFLFLSCNSFQKKEFVCGDRPCIDKKEFNEYFSKNLVIEIKTDNKKKLQIVDLAKLNTNSSTLKKNYKKTTKQDQKLERKAKKEKLKADKTKLMEARKLEKAEKKLKEREKKLRIKEKKQILKASKSSVKEKEKSNSLNDIEASQATISVEKKITEGTKKKPVINKNIQIDSVEAKNIKSLCAEIEDCNIDKIAEILIKKGKDKPFPNIASN
jgi:hypothetical protein